MRLSWSLSLAAALFTASGFTQATETKPVLTVYTYDSFAGEWGPGPKIKLAFEAECNCELKWVKLEDGVAILNRISDISDLNYQGIERVAETSKQLDSLAEQQEGLVQRFRLSA